MKRDRQARWDAENMVTLSTRLPRREAVEARALLRLRGENAYRVLKRAMRQWMDGHRLDAGSDAEQVFEWDCYSD